MTFSFYNNNIIIIGTIILTHFQLTLIAYFTECLGTSVNSTIENGHDPLQETLCTKNMTHSDVDLLRKARITFISSIALATVFTLWVVISTMMIIILLKLKLKRARKLTRTTQVPSTTSTRSSHSVDLQTKFDTSDNVAYGMITAGSR